ncbi:S8 family serine peptidase [Sphingomonas sanguinis]|uniref:S8 family serine peptidase n=1 Tax=Sphingomonas sp. LC-1 TaxID=3110957 RepID=UPI0021BB91AC|nr:S8 family serine peptidase [Sphingomonas sp. LC-1]MCT8004012.1 S8 family serine peptidase [Sphingomonas sp. LC-1]
MSAKAAYAYDRGITGKGVTIAIIDSGIARSSPEFAGRISVDSTGFEQRVARCATCPGETVPPFAIDDNDGHGSKVASIAAAARNGSGMQGLAPDATILVLKVTGPDLDGVTAGSTTPIREGTQPNAGLIAPALREAVAKGAFVTVMSLNGFGGGQVATEQRAAMDGLRAADRLLVESVANETGKDSFAGQFAETLVGSDRANADWLLFAIGVDANGNPRSANGNAGVLADRMIAAVGVNVQAIDKDGSITTVTGNSFAAPAVGGAAALLKQYWPQLGGKAIARILLDTATDMGAPGVDPIYGAGLLNVEKAMQAQAPASSFAAAQAVLARYSSLDVSAPFGGSATASMIATAAGSMTVFDRYGRDFAMTGTTGIRARSSGLLAGGMTGSVDSLPVRRSSVSEARLGFAGQDVVGPWQGATANRPAVASFSPAAGQTVTVGANTAVDGSGLSLTGSPLRGVVGQPRGLWSSWSGGGWSASFSSGSSRDRSANLRGVTFATPLGIGLEVTDLTEYGRVLGFGGGVAASGLRGGRTTLATLVANRTVAGVSLTARATTGTTSVDSGSDGPIRFEGRIVSTAFAVEGARPLFGGLATLGLSSPLRVERARASLMVPVAYDLMSGALAEERRTFDLSPTARELDLELGWSTALAPSSTLRFGVAHAFDAGHVRGASDVAAFFNLVIR